jgi:cytochrome c553
MNVPGMALRLSALHIALSLSLAGAAAAAAPPPPGASACSGCHAADSRLATPVPRLFGRKPADIEAALEDFKAGRRPATVMDRIAKGFSDDEIKSIAAWYGAQR